MITDGCRFCDIKETHNNNWSTSFMLAVIMDAPYLLLLRSGTVLGYYTVVWV